MSSGVIVVMLEVGVVLIIALAIYLIRKNKIGPDNIERKKTPFPSEAVYQPDLPLTSKAPNDSF